jgi:hypothetical protein
LPLHEDDLATAGSRLWSELARLGKGEVGIGIYVWERYTEVLKTAVQERLRETEAEAIRVEG